MGVGVASLTIPPNNPLVECSLPILATLSSDGLEIFVPKSGGCFHKETPQWFFPGLEDETVTWTFWVPYAIELSREKRG